VLVQTVRPHGVTPLVRFEGLPAVFSQHDFRQTRDGSVLDVGRKTRGIPPAIRRALTARDGQCRFPCCTGRHTDAHHIEHWADGGPTRLDNLVLLCRRHHRAVHEEGWTVAWGVDGEVQFTRSNGERLETAPPAPRWQDSTTSRSARDVSPLAPTVERLTSAGIFIGPRTGSPQWYGERFDAEYVLDVLRQGEEHARRARPVGAETGIRT
jgi:hypothetical protein